MYVGETAASHCVGLGEACVDAVCFDGRSPTSLALKGQRTLEHVLFSPSPPVFRLSVPAARAHLC